MLMELSSSIVCVYSPFSFESTIKYGRASQCLRAKIAVMDLYTIANFEIVLQVLEACQKGMQVPNVQEPVSYDELPVHCSIIYFVLYIISDIQLFKLSM